MNMKFKTLSIVLISLSLFSLDLFAQEASDIVIIQLFDVASGNSREAFMVTLTPDDKQEIVFLEKVKAKPELAATNYMIFKKEISKWLEDKYEIITISSDEWQTIPRTTAFLQKKEEN
jgi:hypothetical protein